MNSNVGGRKIADLGDLIDVGKLDPVELAQYYLDAISASPFGNDIYARTTPERALAEAEAAKDRAKRGMRKHRVDGVPVSWKDLFDSAGVVTEAGSMLLKGRTPDADCEVLRRATEAGCVCLGKTHMSELAFSGLGVNPNTATPPNRYDPDLAPGGSSSGAGSSVAYDLAPIGIGSDTGGSVRIPSAWNGLVGLKTTVGVVPNDGVVPLCKGFDTVGPLARSVEDAGLMFSILSGQEVDLETVPSLSGLKFLICETQLLDDCGDDQLAGFEAAVAQLEKRGAQVERGPIPEVEKLTGLGPTLFPYEAWQQWGKEIDLNPDAIFEPVRNRFTGGRDVTAEQYKKAWQKMLKQRQSYNQRVAGYDAVIAPTVPVAPPRVSDLMADFTYFWDANLMALRNTRAGNMLGLCALTLPTDRDASGLMLFGPPNTEERLLQIGLAAESALESA